MELVGLPNAEKSHTHSQSNFTQCCKCRWVSLTTHRFLPETFFFFFWTKYNNILERPSEGGAGSTQVQIQSYRNRQRGNLAQKSKKRFPQVNGLEAIISSYLWIWLLFSEPNLKGGLPPWPWVQLDFSSKGLLAPVEQKIFIMGGVQKYLPNCWKMALNGNLPLLSSSKNHNHCVCHAHQRLTHSQCLESWTPQGFGFRPHSLSFGVAMAPNSNEKQSVLPLF